MEPMGKQVMQPATKPELKPEPKPLKPTDPEVLAETHVPATVSRSVYQTLQERYFGSIIESDSNEKINCANIPLDSYNKTSRIEECRVIADGDMKVSSAELFAHAMEETGFLAQKGLAPIDVFPLPTFSLRRAFIGSFRKTHAYCPKVLTEPVIPYNRAVLVSLAVLDSVLKAAGIEMKAPVRGTCIDEPYARYEQIVFDIRGSNTIKAENHAFRTFWPADGSTYLPVQNVFDALQEQFLEYLNTTSATAEKEPATEQAKAE